MTLSMRERHLLAALGWLATVATSLSMFPALQEKRYFLIGAGLSAIVVGLAMAARALRVPTVVILVGQILLLSEVLLVVYGGHSWYGLPTSATLRSVNDAVSSGMDVAQRYAAPVPPSAGLMLMTVGFVAAIAIAVDLMAAGLGRAPLAGLPLLALYAVPVAAIPDGVPAWAFVPGAAAFLGLLMVAEHERLTHWGRHVARSSSMLGSVDTVDTSALSAAGRRISVLAIATAVVLPLLVPGFSQSLFHGRGGIGDGNGPGLSFGDPMVSLATALHRKDPLDLIEVTSKTPPSYLRLAVLDEPGANAWTNSGIDSKTTIPMGYVLPSAEGLSGRVATTPASMSVTLTPDFPRDSIWLPVPFDLTFVHVTMHDGGYPEDFAYVPRDQTVATRASGAVSRLAYYSASYKVVHPTESELANATPAPAAIVTNYASVPAGVPSVVGQVARQVTASAADDYQRALALQSFFRDNNAFAYDLHAAYGYGYRAMARFLQARRGFCQHFAATMAMMAREVGIPSRVVVGFLSPSVKRGDGYVFTTQDEHSWPELYFGGVGWVRFEPTPGNGTQIPGYTHGVTVPPVAPVPTGSTSPTDLPGGGKQSDEITTSAALQPPSSATGSGDGSGPVPPVGWLVLLVVAALALAPALVRTAVRRSRMARAIDGGASCEYAWLELRDRVVDLHLPWSGSLTPRARQRFVEPLLGGDPDGVAALDRLSMTVERARYAGSPVRGAEPGKDAREVMAAISRGADWKRRLRAFFWPTSLLPGLRSGPRWARPRGQ